MLLLFLSILSCNAFVSENKEEFVYELNLWNGKNFNFTFCPQAIREIYIMANEYNIFNLKRTEVYYWPITREYKANWYKKNESISGYLEILKDNKVIKKIEPEIYSLKYNNITKESKLLIGEKAQDEYNQFQEKQKRYLESIRSYYEERQKYEEKIYNLLEEGGELKTFLDDETTLSKPKEPIALTEFVSEPEKALVLKINEGNYKIIYKDESGKAIQGTEKELIAFTNRRNGIGYQIFPEESWINTHNSNEIGDILYIEGNQTVFIKPFNSTEYPALGYSKLSALPIYEPRKIRENVWKWVYLSPGYQEVKLELVNNGEVVYETTQKPYYIKQIQGYALGYEIVDWTEDLSITPTFIGYKVEISDAGKYIIRMIDKNNKTLDYSVRQVCNIYSQNIIWLFLISILPVAIGIIVLLKKNKHNYN